MNNNVNKLLDVDRQARQMLDEAQQYYERTLYEIQQEKQEMMESYSRRGKQHLETLTAELADEVDEVVQTVRARTAGLLADMQAHYDQHHEQWETTLAEKCMGRDLP